MIGNEAANVVEGTGREFARHERVVGNVVLAVETEAMGGAKPKSGVVVRVAQHHHGVDAAFGAGAQSVAHEPSADAAPLVLGPNRHRCEPHDVRRTVRPVEVNGAKENVADDGTVRHGDEGDVRVDESSQPVDEVGFVTSVESTGVNGADGVVIARAFGADGDGH